MSSQLRDLSATAERHARDARTQSEASLAALAQTQMRRSQLGESQVFARRHIYPNVIAPVKK